MTLNLYLNKNKIVLEEDQEIHEKLVEVQIPLHQEVLKEQSLYDTRISPISHLTSSLSCKLFINFTCM